MPIIHKPDPSEQKEALKRAQDASNRGDGLGMLQGLCDSMLFEGYGRYFKRRYSSLAVDDINDIIGIATDEIYDRIVKGEKIPAIQSYLWKVTDRKLSEFSDRRNNLVRGSVVERIGVRDPIVAGTAVQEEKEKRREQAIALAEQLLPRLGLVNVQNVMRYILGAIRNGAQDISSTEIAEALNLSPENVRQSLRRGFERLARIIREEKLVNESYDFPFLDETRYYIDEAVNESEKSSEESEYMNNEIGG